MKILNFIWKLLHDSIPVFSILNSRGIAAPTRCLLCDDNDETINHLFLTCPFARAVWHGYTLGIRTSHLANASVRHWIASLLYCFLPPGAKQDDVPSILLHHPLVLVESYKLGPTSRKNT